ncbi:hypothetical protein [Faecalimonas sp.]
MNDKIFLQKIKPEMTECRVLQIEPEDTYEELKKQNLQSEEKDPDIDDM